MRLPILAFNSVDSTNSQALRQCEDAQSLPFLLVADQQLCGRGRGGKVWSSPSGNFYGTFALNADQSDAAMAQLSFVAAVALAQVLEDVGLRPKLKWPNDVLVQQAKISGILLEKHGSVLLIGMGINVQFHPADPSYPTTSLRDLGCDLTVEALSQRLSVAVPDQIDLWKTKGFTPIRQSWLDRAHGLGAPIVVRLTGQADRQGIFHGLGADGALQLRTSDRLETIHAGQVYFHATGH